MVFQSLFDVNGCVQKGGREVPSDPLGHDLTPVYDACRTEA